MPGRRRFYKGKSLEAMQATLGDATVKSEDYKALSAGNKTKLAAFMAEHSNADAGSNKWQRRCRDLSLQIAEGVSLSLPDDRKKSKGKGGKGKDNGKGKGGKGKQTADKFGGIKNSPPNRCWGYNFGSCSTPAFGLVCPSDPTKLHTCSKCGGAGHSAKECKGQAQKTKPQQQQWNNPQSAKRNRGAARKGNNGTG